MWLSERDIGGTPFCPTDTEVAFNNICGNSPYGLLNDSTSDIVSAQHNWWGDGTGPFDGKTLPGVPDYNNPGGLGDAVSSYVDYANWLNAPVGSAPIPEPVTLLGVLAAAAGLGGYVRRRRAAN